MASGNRTPGPRAEYETVNTYIKLPRELDFLCSAYAKHMRLTSRSQAIQRLLETHPELVKLANTLYYRDNDTSPR
jgi:hypothetical protein